MTFAAAGKLPFGYRTLSVLRHLPRFPGKWRAAAWVARRMPDRPGCVVPGSAGLRLAFPSLKEPIAFEWLINGRYEPETVAFLSALLGPGDTFLDVGANVGAITIPVARAVGSTGRVISAEASPTLSQYLQSNLVRNSVSNVYPVRALVAATDEESAPFFDAPDASFGMGGRTAYPGYHESRVVAKRADTILQEVAAPTPRVMKIDVEGHELDVLRGAERALRADRPPVVVFEFNDWSEANAGFAAGSAQEHILKLGFRLRTLAAAATGGPYLTTPLRSGSVMLVATHPSTEP